MKEVADIMVICTSCPVHGTCVWLCILCLGIQTGNDVMESGQGTMDMTSHCCFWLCDRWLKKFQTPRHRRENHAFWRICYDRCTTLMSGVLAGGGDTLELFNLLSIDVFLNVFTRAIFKPHGCSRGTLRLRGSW